MMRKWIKRFLEWVHVFLILSVIAPIVYMGDSRRVPEQIYNIYFTSYILLLPVVILMSTSRKSKKFWQYLLVVICTYMAVSFGAKQLSALFLDEIADMIYVGTMLICTCLIAFLAYAMRIYKGRRQEAKETGDASWREAEFELDKPNKWVCLWFVGVYVYALNMDCLQLCNVALYSTLAYLLVASAHEFLDKTKDYLKLNEEACKVRNIPSRRIYGIGKFFLLAYLCMLLLAIVPAVLTIGNRNYHDIRISYPSKTGKMEQLDVSRVMEDFPEIMPEEMEQEPVNETMVLILNIIVYVIAAITTLIVIVGFLVMVKRELAKFSQTAYEEDDVVESLDSPDEEEGMGSSSPLWKKRTAEDKTRRQYRKFIRKHRKDKPAHYETPTEIETAAGVVDTEEGKELHKQYELARYGSN